MAEFRLETERLILRDWQHRDRIAFHAINTDPRVMRFLGPLMTLEDVDALILRMQQMQAGLGHCFWAVERKEDGRLIGWCGLIRGAQNTPIADCLEVGWRLSFDMWGQGYAQEVASAAITVDENDRSWGLMERLGMSRHVELGFDHPNVPDGSPLKRHVTYSIDRDIWAAVQS
jgi:RimJ/RimL family protein N-acetyltransferase